MDELESKNGWNEYAIYVLKELERLNRLYERLEKKYNKLDKAVLALKIKVGIWGAAGGCLPPGLALLIWYLTRG